MSKRVISPVDLRTVFSEAPANVDRTPRFSWRIAANERGAKQTAYRILVARDRLTLAEDQGDAWDSGRVESGRAIDVEYTGEELGNDETLYWKVRTWDESETPSAWSEPAMFTTAPQHPAGEWVSHQPNGGDSNGYRSRWRPADAEATEWISVDLGESQTIRSVRLHPACPFEGVETPDGLTVSPMFAEGLEETNSPVHYPGSTLGFGFPDAFRIEVADDPAFEHVTESTIEDVENPGADPVTVDLETEGRYVRVSAVAPYELDPADGQRKLELVREELSRWQVFALANLSVQNAEGDDVARGRPVDASSSVETATWGANDVTNGRPSEMASSSPQLRQEVTLSKSIASARVHFAGLGYGELYINGERVSDDVLNPAWTQFDERVLYNTYDVTDHLREGENALGIWLGRGWFSKSFYDWTGFGSPRAKLSLRVEYEDGTTRTVTTGPDWCSSESPILENDVYDGETYDARLERDGWAAPRFDDGDWRAVTVVSGPGGTEDPQRMESMRVVETIEPETLSDHPDGPIVDFGQNLTGWVELSVSEADRGRKIVLEHAETLTDDGNLSTIDLRTADVTDTYIARGDGEEVYEPRFTYHGFRYAQVKNYPGELTADNLTAKVVHTAMDPTGEFACSNEELERVQHASEWGLRGNSHAVPTDCPQRDERFGWTGDGRLTARAFQYNFDALAFHEKWLADHDDAQSEHGYLPDTIPYGFGTIPSDPTWSITEVTIPWYLYEHYGDQRILESRFEGMRRYVDYWDSVAEDGILPAEYGNYGDWLAFENTDDEHGTVGQPLELFNTAAHYQSTAIVGEAAAVLGYDHNAERYRARAESIAGAFNERFLAADSGRYEPETQAAQAIPLFLKIVPDDSVEDVATFLAQSVRDAGGQLRTGFLGTRALMHALTDYGYEELAYEVVSQPEQPGWVYMVRNGATTIWERWDSDAKVGSGMNSLNHSPFTMVSEWLYRGLAGISPELNDHHVEIAPAIIDDLDWLEATVDTPVGPASVDWERDADRIRLAVSVPWNTIGTVVIPNGYDVVKESDGTVWTATSGVVAEVDGVQSVTEDGTAIEVAAGDYEFVLE